MQYSLLFYNSRETEVDGPDMPAWMRYIGELQEAGVLRGGEQLRPVTAATSVRIRDGRRQVEDGPFADTKEQLGGFVLIDVDGLDAALDWAARCPGALDGTVEVRPVVVRGDAQHPG